MFGFDLIAPIWRFHSKSHFRDYQTIQSGTAAFPHRINLYTFYDNKIKINPYIKQSSWINFNSFNPVDTYQN